MTAVGLELAEDAIRVAVLEGGRAGVKLKAFETRKVDTKKGEASDDIVSVLEEVLKTTRAPRGAVVASIRAQDCTIRELVVPFREDDKIRKTIKYQAESYFTTQSIDDLIIEFSKFSEAENKAKLLVAGVRKTHVGRRLELLSEAGVDPLAIDLDVAALFNAYAHFGAFEGHGAVLVVDIDKDTLKVGVVEEGKLRLARAIRMRLGSMRLDGHRPGALAKREADDDGVYETAADESARLPVVILDEGDDEAFSLEDSGITESEREGILHRVFMEIDRTVATVQLGRDMDLILLTGPSCRLDGIEQVFTEHFEVPARRFDLAGPLGAEDGDGRDAPSLSLEGGAAVGLALKALGIDHSGMDFRQEEFVYRGTFGQIKRALACTVTLLFAFAFLAAFMLKQELQERQGRLQSVRSLQANVFTVVFPSIQDPSTPHLPLRVPDNYFQSLQAEVNALRARYGGAGPGQDGPSVSALEVLREFAQAKSQVKGFQIEVMKIAVDPRATGKSRFVCLANDQPASIELGKQFESNVRFNGYARETRFDKKSGKWQFEFLVEFRQEEGR